MQLYISMSHMRMSYNRSLNSKNTMVSGLSTEFSIREHIIACAGERAVSGSFSLSVQVSVLMRFDRRLFIFVINESVSDLIASGRCEMDPSCSGTVTKDARHRLYAAADGRFTWIVSQQFTILLDMKLMLSVTITNDMCMRGLLQRI